MKIQSENFLSNENPLSLLKRKNSILEGLTFKELNFTIPKIKEKRISEHEFLYVYHDPTLPIVNLNILFEGGIESQPHDEPALLPILVEVWENGGANGKGPEEISEALAELGVEFQISLHQEIILVEMYVLKDNFQKAFSILKEILLKPEFSEERLHTTKLKFKDNLKRRNDKPEQIASRKIKELFEHPRKVFESISPEEIDKVQKRDLIHAYQKILKTRRMHVTIDGDLEGIPYEEMISSLSEEMGEIQNPFVLHKENKPKLGRQDLKNTILLIEKNVPQAVIVLGTKVPSYNDPKNFSLRSSNYILGGGSFVSKMMREIRVKRGLAYYAYSHIRFFHEEGRFTSSTGTNVNQAPESLKIMLDLIENFHLYVSDEDVEITKEALINSHVFEFSNPTRILRSIVLERIYQTPENYLVLFPSKIRSITKKEIIQDFQSYITANQLWIVVVGPRSLEKELKKFNRKVLIFDPDQPL
ncbi:MAG: insulinase family protein [Leptospiraceae bacterium]|nr:insulinase family protein [Leptospiraceae bacterium]MDW7976413.1 pitrilysin family protein [Leptospiraceae bacterium]